MMLSMVAMANTIRYGVEMALGAVDRVSRGCRLRKRRGQKRTTTAGCVCVRRWCVVYEVYAWCVCV